MAHQQGLCKAGQLQRTEVEERGIGRRAAGQWEQMFNLNHIFLSIDAFLLRNI